MVHGHVIRDLVSTKDLPRLSDGRTGPVPDRLQPALHKAHQNRQQSLQLVLARGHHSSNDAVAVVLDFDSRAVERHRDHRPARQWQRVGRRRWNARAGHGDGPARLNADGVSSRATQQRGRSCGSSDGGRLGPDGERRCRSMVCRHGRRDHSPAPNPGNVLNSSTKRFGAASRWDILRRCSGSVLRRLAREIMTSSSRAILASTIRSLYRSRQKEH